MQGYKSIQIESAQRVSLFLQGVFLSSTVSSGFLHSWVCLCFSQIDFFSYRNKGLFMSGANLQLYNGGSNVILNVHPVLMVIDLVLLNGEALKKILKELGR
ncbi:hypothetical protein L6452_31832 [Arctium lappa]|uniref:Uncharacterized protein n=1 Tax=Arctium lappa TaxID=4217 RepID=A0ACB8Z3I5_ARCLA|nr:hypothetical protein L6452_31832 [Arctium lappa]